MRLRNVTNARNALEQHPDLIILDPSKHRGRWQELFDNDKPMYLEIGMGKGQFICGMAQKLPDINFLGLEKYDSVALRALQKIIAAPCPNAMLIRGEAENLPNYFSPGEIGRIYLNFSDPWPRKCHIKRRLTHSNFMDKYKNILITDGEIHLKTDNKQFFEFTLQHLNECGMKFDHISLDLHSQEPVDNVRTEYEDSKSAVGALIYRLVCRFG
ncbi:MAG: tRNA (guanosine(46)-N7)-methyltransferase TrmB [Holophagaceae bacterium]|nr:tRNA (guanosine(46)-N7)-methyltransferase TrmB [Holophagaceae bacterium]